MKGIKMIVSKFNSTTFKVVLGFADGETYYIQKGKTGAWKIAQKGQILDFASTRDQAINKAVSIFKGISA